MSYHFEELDVSLIYPPTYTSASYHSGLDLTPTRGKDNIVKLSVSEPLSEKELLLVAETHLYSTLYAHDVTIEQVVFTPPDTLTYIHGVGKPVHIFFTGLDLEGNSNYEMETRFRLKTEEEIL